MLIEFSRQNIGNITNIVYIKKLFKLSKKNFILFYLIVKILGEQIQGGSQKLESRQWSKCQDTFKM